MTEQHTTRVGPRARLFRCAVTTAAVIALVTTAGCTNNPTPEPLPDHTSAASGTPSPSVSSSPDGPPTLPPEAKGTSKRAAVAFVKHWVASLNYAMRSLDAAPLEQLASNKCRVCEVVIGRVELVAEGGGFMRGSGWRVQEAQYLAGQPRGAPVVRTVIDIAPQIVVERDGQEPERFEGGRVLYTFHLGWATGSWIVDHLERAT